MMLSLPNVEKVMIYGSPNIGVFIFANDNVALVPQDAPRKVEEAVVSTLKVRVVRCMVMKTVLLGVLVAGNNNGILVPRTITDDELDDLKRNLRDMNIAVLPDRRNAVGNLILVNDNAAILDPNLSKEAVRTVSDALGVEVIQRKIAGQDLVGAVAAVSNKGIMVHPLASDEEVEYLASFFRVSGNIGTINRGNPFIRSGIVVNTKGALVGFETTGPEIMRIHATFFS